MCCGVWCGVCKYIEIKKKRWWCSTYMVLLFWLGFCHRARGGTGDADGDRAGAGAGAGKAGGGVAVWVVLSAWPRVVRSGRSYRHCFVLRPSFISKRSKASAPQQVVSLRNFARGGAGRCGAPRVRLPGSALPVLLFCFAFSMVTRGPP